MNVDAVMGEVGTRLDEIPGLKVLPFAATAAPTLPGALISLPPRGTYDLTYGQGMDMIRLDITILVTRTIDASARAAVTPFISGSGESSVRQKLSSRNTSWTSFSVLHIVDFQLAVITLNKVKHLGAVFAADVYGSGGA